MSKMCQFRVIELPVLSAPIHSIEDDDAAQSASVYTLWSISSHAFHRIALSEHVLRTMCFTICLCTGPDLLDGYCTGTGHQKWARFFAQSFRHLDRADDMFHDMFVH